MTISESISANRIVAHTERVLSSSFFSRSSALTGFLRFIIELTLEGKAHEIKEYRLGVEVFGRGGDFDPRIDPVVRVHAAKLRARLAEYYASEGQNERLVITIPRGGYIPVFTETEAVAGVFAAQSPSIAVLPFVSMSVDVENEYFSDGLTEELINVLTYVQGLHVVARTSVFCFKNVAKDIREIGAQLGVRTVLEGSVRKAGNQVRVTAQLIDVATGYHLLSRTFVREFKDVFALQEELAGAVVTEITGGRQTGTDPAVVDNNRTPATQRLAQTALSTVNYSFRSGVMPHSACGGEQCLQ